MAKKHLSRRAFLKTSGAIGALGAAGVIVSSESRVKPALAEEKDGGAPNEKVDGSSLPKGLAFYYDQVRCIGCKNCTKACAEYKQLPEEFVYRRVYKKSPDSPVWELNEKSREPWGDHFAHYLSVSCNHCDNPACAHACPTKAMHKKEDNGLVVVDESRCIGCGYCYLACPYDAPRIDAKAGHSRKCNFCEERQVVGEKPMCVASCPMNALDFGTDAEIMERHPDAKIAESEPLPKFIYTTPHFFMRSADMGDNKSLAGQKGEAK